MQTHRPQLPGLRCASQTRASRPRTWLPWRQQGGRCFRPDACLSVSMSVCACLCGSLSLSAPPLFFSSQDYNLRITTNTSKGLLANRQHKASHTHACATQQTHAHTHTRTHAQTQAGSFNINSSTALAPSKTRTSSRVGLQIHKQLFHLPLSKGLDPKVDFEDGADTEDEE